MGKKSISAKIVSDLLNFWPKYSKEEAEDKIAKVFEAGEKPTSPPKTIVTRYEDRENGRIFYVNEKGVSRYVVFYIHGGSYFHDIIPTHWKFIDKLVRETNAQVVVPAYRLVPFATYKEAYDFIVPIYKDYCERFPEKKIMIIGDSAGGGLSLALTEYLKAEGIRLPDELILFSPWVDVSMENKEIKDYQQNDPFLLSDSLIIFGKRWAGDLDTHDYRVSPIYGDLKGLKNVTVFVGTDEIIYPDAVKMFHMLDKDVSNELIVGEGMNHVYPLLPIKEADSADNKVFHIVLR